MESSLLRILPAAALLACACASSPKATIPSPSLNPITSGAFVGSSPFKLDLSVADLKLRVGEAGDSVRWSMYTHPAGCAIAAPSRHEIKAKDRRNRCAVEWEISIPAFEDVKVDVSVGDIDVIAPSDRAVQLRTDVGAIRVRLDDRLLQHDNAPGSGDRWNIGNVLATPRLVAKVDVGAIRVDLKTSTAGKSP
jgi:hypothetical protein